MSGEAYPLHHHQNLESLGDPKFLTDKFRVHFTKLLHSLEEKPEFEKDCFTSSSTQYALKEYMTILNTQRMMPLHFRLHTLGSLESYISYFDSDMIYESLRSYHIAVELIRSETGGHPEHFPALVDMINVALDLAVKQLQFTLGEHQDTDHRAVRRVFDLAKIGVPLLSSLFSQKKSRTTKMLRTLTWYSLLRRLDFFGKNKETQSLLVKALEKYLDHIRPMLFMAGESIVAPKDSQIRRVNIYLEVDLSSPDKLPTIVTDIGSKATYDCILFPMSRFLDEIALDVKSAKLDIKTLKKQKSDSPQIRDLHYLVHSGELIMKTLLIRLRHGNRKAVSNTYVILETAASKAFLNSRKSNHVAQSELQEEDHVSSWSVIEYSAGGVSIESTDHTAYVSSVEIDSMIGLRWVGEKTGQVLGFVRWYKEEKNGHQRMGIEFLTVPCYLRRAVTVGRRWIVLEEMKQNKDRPMRMWFPESEVEVGMPFVIESNQDHQHCYVDKILRRGPNYSLALVVVNTGEEDVTEEELDVDWSIETGEFSEY
ncbi:MAG: hypothetical protein Q9M28_06895 [Mariprofundaceae bacterium]|nr:hypothetical protein [Mariprofundaceae bacterium]